jgi:hypothetical protein
VCIYWAESPVWYNKLFNDFTPDSSAQPVTLGFELGLKALENHQKRVRLYFKYRDMYLNGFQGEDIYGVSATNTPGTSPKVESELYGTIINDCQK